MTEPKINWYRTPIERDLLKQLTRRSDLRGLIQAGSFLLIFLGTTYLACFFFLRRLWIPMIAVSYLHCVFHSFVGMQAAVHELSHGTPFKTKWLNEFFYRLFCFLTWNNPLHFRTSHMLHHQYTVHRGLDKEVVIAPISFTLLDYLSWFLFDFEKSQASCRAGPRYTETGAWVSKGNRTNFRDPEAAANGTRVHIHA